MENLAARVSVDADTARRKKPMQNEKSARILKNAVCILLCLKKYVSNYVNNKYMYVNLLDS